MAAVAIIASFVGDGIDCASTGDGQKRARGLPLNRPRPAVICTDVEPVFNGRPSFPVNRETQVKRIDVIVCLCGKAVGYAVQPWPRLSER